MRAECKLSLCVLTGCFLARNSYRLRRKNLELTQVSPSTDDSFQLVISFVFLWDLKLVTMFKNIPNLDSNITL